ncbi:MAG TPA: oxygen-dependent coproporphyrinogen oxidase [Mariniphaga sp.]|nr:oxygen-dependent coproporphyrinogen oxidase [Mariniphaga sp.]
MKNIETIANEYKKLQQAIIKTLEEADEKGKFRNDKWTSELGTGVTSVISDGAIIEKGAVNFSYVKGKFSSGMEKILGEKASQYSATGISSILHPHNPWMPIIHMNVRYFALDNGTSWFGGGIDLTPHYINTTDAADFHQTLKDICDQYNSTFYPDFKKRADEYFYLPHRNETRGIGGIFFDRLKPNEENSLETLFKFTVSLAKQYPVIYCNLMKKHGRRPFSSQEKEWQNLRRGRYVEFNLVHDRGTKFGLESGGNIESILVSLPASATWKYNYEPEPGSKEEQTLLVLKKGINWVDGKTIE